MPELPEVESLVRGVRDALKGKRIANVAFFRPDIREPIPTERLAEILVGKKVTDVARRGKYMLIHTSEGALGVHLGMSGRFVASLGSDMMAPHTHACFQVEDGAEFRFIDPRRFGRLFSLENHEITTHPFLSKLGVEPLNEQLDLARHLFDASRSRTQAVKVFLMDSEVVVGVGNIYASEALWRAKINPMISAKTLQLRDFRALAKHIKLVLQDAIDAGGTTFRDYRDKDGNPGYFQKNLSVYGKESMPCPRCRSKVCRITQAGRSTFFCPVCQK